MAVSTQIPVAEYLSTVYEPDMEYVDGELEERYLGEYEHNVTQRAILFWFHTRRREWSVRAIQEQRTKVAATRYRLPDISVFRRDTPVESIFTHPQLIAIEVLSREDRTARLNQRIRDFIDFGVRNIWLIDPHLREGWDCSSGNWIKTTEFSVPDSPIVLSLDELFSSIEAEEA